MHTRSMPTVRQNVVSRLTRLYPFYSGCGSFANSALVQRLAGSSHESTWARVPGGEVLAPLEDYVGRAAYYAGELDRKITWICSRLIRPGDTVLDIGANIGMITVAMAKLVGSEGRVHSFEPNPSMIGLLRQAIARNHLSNVRLHPVALGPQPATLELRIPRMNSGAASLVRNRHDSDCEIVNVPVRQLDSVAMSEGIRSIRLIKIDVEGYEAEVLRGADTLLERMRPDAILFELNEHVEGPIHNVPVIKILMERDYEFLAIQRSFVRMRLERFVPGSAHTLVGHDFLAVARGASHNDIISRMNVAI